jgi:hypothetical protein
MGFSLLGLVGLFILTIAAAMAGIPIADLDEQVVEWSAAAVALLWSVLFFWRLAHHLRAVGVGMTDA